MEVRRQCQFMEMWHSMMGSFQVRFTNGSKNVPFCGQTCNYCAITVFKATSEWSVVGCEVSFSKHIWSRLFQWCFSRSM